jgi:hypothetical protein
MLYFLETSTDIKEIGAYFQVKSMSEGYDYNTLNSISAMSSLGNDEVPSFIPDLENFVLKPKAKLTDIISTGYASDKGFLISDKARSIFKIYNIDKGIYYPAGVEYKGQKFAYSFLYVASYLIENEMIDFPRSKFTEKKISEIINNVSFDNFEQMMAYSRKKNPIHEIGFEKIHLKKEISNLDMFRIGYVDNNIIVSERLKKDLKAQGITGIKFTDVENIF